MIKKRTTLYWNTPEEEALKEESKVMAKQSGRSLGSFIKRALLMFINTLKKTDEYD